MFYDSQKKEMQEKYIKLLKTIGAISNLFATGNVPYMDYRVVENIFCIAFECKNLSRLDCSIDASKDNIGIGIKTFLHSNGKTFQKIAEFNDKSNEIRKIEDILIKVIYITVLRNERISVTERIHGLNKSIYHLLTRQKNKFSIFEVPMEKIDEESIKIIKSDDKSIIFKDKFNEYNFNISKSVLMQRFVLKNPIIEIPVKIIDEPYEILVETVKNAKSTSTTEYEIAFLPLYSYNKSKNNCFVPQKSGLNMWNAGGRKRNVNEVYITIPQSFKSKHEKFFPSRNQIFELILPNGKTMSAKVCQDNNKALMSNPNALLGKWMLRDILKLDVGELVTYSKLSNLGIDAVEIIKFNDLKFGIDFASKGAYEKYINQ